MTCIYDLTISPTRSDLIWYISQHLSNILVIPLEGSKEKWTCINRVDCQTYAHYFQTGRSHWALNRLLKMMHVIILVIKFLILQTIFLISLSGEILCCYNTDTYSVYTFTFHYYLLFSLSIASVLSKAVFQTPQDLLKNVEDTAVLYCSHNVTDYNLILWYKMSSSGSEMKYLGNIFVETPNPEESRINLSGDGRSKGSMSIPSLSLQDSAVYFCAAYLHSA